MESLCYASGFTAKLLGRLPCLQSPRAVRVYGLVARGLTNRATGRDLAISEATVKTHTTEPMIHEVISPSATLASVWIRSSGWSEVVLARGCCPYCAVALTSARMFATDQ
ncbi:LuxR C-terminal-related transcriptional regulator [Nocardia gamkensis]|uniref:LuxR C-terminal-related transcriptional regulator n=1 Tax=Nocardia gamkensis TaxID=352869 RepID=UPI0036E4416A